jgi:hypothetical protein
MEEHNYRNDTTTIGATSIKICERILPPKQRKVILITNTSVAGGQVFSIGIGTPAVAGSGIVLYPTASYGLAIDNVSEPPQIEIYAIASAAGGTLAIHEDIGDI